MGDYQVIRVFAKALYQVTALRPVDPNWKTGGAMCNSTSYACKRLDERFDERLRELYEKITRGKKMEGDSRRARSCSILDFRRSGVLRRRWAGRGAETMPLHPIQSREALKDYDPDLYTLVHETMAYGGHVDWRLKP
jgi:hypothetical protein